jgi:hypothetical protein
MNITHLRPRFGPPVVVTLDYADAKEVTSQLHGDVEYMFTCNDGSVKFYAPRGCYEQIARLNPEAGATVSIRKSKKGTKVFYEAALVSDAEEPEPEPEAQPEPAPAPRVVPKKVEIPPAKYTQATPANGHAAEATKAISLRALQFAQCIKDAVDALQLGAAHAQDVAFPVTFLGESVKSVAVTFFIRDCDEYQAALRRNGNGGTRQ